MATALKIHEARLAAVAMDASPALLPGMTAVGLDLPEDLTLEDWTRTGHGIARLGRALWWVTGDWLRYGADHFGELMAQAASETGLSEDQLLLCQRVAGAFVDKARRHVALTFSHHAAVAALTEKQADKLLARAEAEGWSVHRLRDAAREVKGRSHDNVDDVSPAVRRLPSVVHALEALAAQERDPGAWWETVPADDRPEVKRALKRARAFLDQLEAVVRGAR